jgi:hypothetical protein
MLIGSSQSMLHGRLLAFLCYLELTVGFYSNYYLEDLLCSPVPSRILDTKALLTDLPTL